MFENTVIYILPWSALRATRYLSKDYELIAPMMLKPLDACSLFIVSIPEMRCIAERMRS